MCPGASHWQPPVAQGVDTGNINESLTHVCSHMFGRGSPVGDGLLPTGERQANGQGGDRNIDRDVNGGINNVASHHEVARPVEKGWISDVELRQA